MVDCLSGVRMSLVRVLVIPLWSVLVGSRVGCNCDLIGRVSMITSELNSKKSYS